MTTSTRLEALTEARLAFRMYVERLERSEILPAEFVHGLAADWDRRLNALGRIGSALPVSDEVLAALRYLARELEEPNLDADAEIRWLDAFPDAVADLFPPSAVTFQIESGVIGVVTRNVRASVTRAVIANAA